MGGELWFGLILVFILLEIISGNMIFVPFSLGAFSSGIYSAFSDNLVLQIAIFSVFSVFALIFLRPFLLRMLYRKEVENETGTGKIVTKIGLAQSEIDGLSGTILVNGEIWSARSVEGTIPDGTSVRIDSISGAIAIVRPIEHLT